MLVAWKNGEQHYKGFGPVELLIADADLISRLNPDYVTSFENWPNFTKRTLGKYVLGTATAELQAMTGENWHYHLVMKFTRLADAQALYNHLRAGTISPVSNFEGQQSAVTAIRQFRDLWREFFLLCRVKLRQLEVG